MDAEKIIIYGVVAYLIYKVWEAHNAEQESIPNSALSQAATPDPCVLTYPLSL